MTRLFEAVAGDITNILSRDTFVISHGVNCLGVMGSGVAMVLANKHRIVRDDYLRVFTGNIHKAPRELLGLNQRVYVDPTTTKKVIINAFTQERCGSDGGVYASLWAIETCVEYALIEAARAGIKEVHIPLIGYGLGGLGGSVFGAYNTAVARFNEHTSADVKLVVVYRKNDLINEDDLRYLSDEDTSAGV